MLDMEFKYMFEQSRRNREHLSQQRKEGNQHVSLSEIKWLIKMKSLQEGRNLSVGSGSPTKHKKR